MLKSCVLLGILLLALALKESDKLLRYPQGFPEMPFPKDNAFSEVRWKLGKRLFYDPILSIDSSISCGSCHQAEFAFANQTPTTPGVFGRAGVRNVPSLANVGYQPYFLREGSVPSLEMQILVPIQEHNEFNHNIVEIAKQLNRDSSYVRASIAAYDRRPDPFVITRAISTFQRSMISGNSPFDRYKYQGDDKALSKQQLAGMKLFYSERLSCAECHGGFNFSNYAFENNGLYAQYEDPGRMRLSNDSADAALFKVPSLRNVGITAPYMHDGSLEDLVAVVEHYDQGGFAHKNKNPLIRPLHLTKRDKEALIAFLQSLTDRSFIEDERWLED